MDNKEVAEFIIAHTNFDFELVSSHRDSYVLSNGAIRVGIGIWADGSIIAEHESNFDKWGKSFYWCDFPQNYCDLRLLISDLAYIDCSDSAVSGKEFGGLTRRF